MRGYTETIADPVKRLGPELSADSDPERFLLE
jgi:hypothetical protein